MTDTPSSPQLDEIRAGFGSVGSLYEAAKFKSALQEARRLSQRVNQYLNDCAPWKKIAEDRARAATTVYVAMQAIDWLKIMWAPILPHSSEQLQRMLGYEQPLFGRQYTEEVDFLTTDCHKLKSYIITSNGCF